MICSLCTKIALYKAGEEGFCRDHRGQAITRSTNMGIATQSRKAAESYHAEMTMLYRLGFARARF
jgi:hypothetical protein